VAERQLGPFVLEKKIGAGAMGVVYLARHAQSTHHVAVKILPASDSQNEKAVARFERELKILTQLTHPHIVRCYGGGRVGSQRFIAMELVSGGTLANVIYRRGHLGWEETIDYGLQICSALEHAHSHGIIHRDLKPSNLLLTEQSQIKLGDFGLARDVDASALTATGRTMGTYGYMAPEQIRGHPPTSQKTDLYSLGCVFFEMLTGRRPFEAENPAEVLFQHVSGTPPRVATLALDCPVWLDSLIEQLLQKDPAHRPMDAIAVAQALTEIRDKSQQHASTLQQAADGQPSTIMLTQSTTEARKLLGTKKRKRKSATPFFQQAWFLAACLAVVVGIMTWMLWPPSEDKLFRSAELLMAGNDPYQWDTARRKYLDSYQRRFPDGPHADQVQGWIDKIEMDATEKRLKSSMRLGRDPSTEAERLYRQAWRYEEFGDRITALEKYESMVNLLSDKPESRPYVNLARRQIAGIEQAGVDKNERIQLVNDALSKADRYYEEGNTLEARKIWNSIVTLYTGNRELDPLVDRARARLSNKEEKPSGGSGGEVP
jgi:serine/threonine protein kinase